MDTDLKTRVLANLFPGCWPALEPWDEFPWHPDRTEACDSWKRHSSQALAIDVFGTVKALAQPQRDAVLDHVAEMLDVPPGGPWRIELEWRDPANRMNENPRHRTQVDAVAFGARGVIFFECKFAEPKLSSCSQPVALRRGKARGIVQCNGNYAMQVNPLNGVQDRCALSGKGIRYWEFIPGLFGLEMGGSHTPCPFAESAFQWMRNLTVVQLIGESEGLVPRLAVVHGHHPSLPMSQYLASVEWQTFADSVRPTNRPHVVTTQKFVQWCSESPGAGTDPWPALAAWVEQKIADGAAKFMTRV